MSSRRHAQVNAIVALLQSLPEAWLDDVLQRLDTRGVVVLETPAKRERRVCGVCGLIYPKCRALADATGDEHDFEPPSSAGSFSLTEEGSTDVEDEDRPQCGACGLDTPCDPTAIACAHPHHPGRPE